MKEDVKMHINIRRYTIYKMLELCKKHKEGKLEKSELETLLSHEDYEIEFKRYGQAGLPMCGINKEEFIEFFMNFFYLKLDDISNQRLKIRYDYLEDFFNNIDFYEEKINQLFNLSEEDFKLGLSYTTNGLPSEINFNNMNFLFTISIGNSCGWPYGEEYVHFDVIGLIVSGILEKDKLINYIGHEMHHIGFNKFCSTNLNRELTLEESLIVFLAFEGLAVKYCNNGQGPITKAIYLDEEPNKGLIKDTWDYLYTEFDEMFNNFKQQIYEIRQGKIGPKELDKLISEYWLSSYTKNQEKNEVPKLKHSKNYYFGCNIWGLIHDVYGKEVVFETIKNPSTFIDVLNKALIAVGREDLVI